jgi:hypothetical protein
MLVDQVQPQPDPSQTADAGDALRIVQEAIELHVALVRISGSEERRQQLRRCYTLLSELCSRWPKGKHDVEILASIWPTDALAFYDAILELRTEHVFLF